MGHAALRMPSTLEGTYLLPATLRPGPRAGPLQYSTQPPGTATRTAPVQNHFTRAVASPAPSPPVPVPVPAPAPPVPAPAPAAPATPNTVASFSSNYRPSGAAGRSGNP